MSTLVPGKVSIFYEIDGESSGLERATVKATTGIENVDKSFDSLKRAATAVGGPVGRAAAAVDNLKGSFKSAAAVVGPSGAFGLSVAGGITVVGLFATALDSLAKAADESREALLRQGLISKEQNEEIKKSAIAVDALGSSWDALKASIVAAIPFDIDAFFTGMTAGVLALSDVMSGEGIKSADEYAAQIRVLKGDLDEAGSSLEAVTQKWDDYIGTMDFVTEQEAIDADFKKRAAARLEEIKRELRLAEVRQRLHEEEMARREEFLGALARENDYQAGLAGQERQRFADNMEDAIAGAAARVQAAQEATGAQNAEIAKVSHASAVASRKHQEAFQNANKATAASYINMASQVLSSLAGMVEQGSFAAKALASLQVVVSTAGAIMQAAASAPPPYNAIPIAAMAALGAAQLVNVWAAKPGQKSIGGGSGGGGNADGAAAARRDTDRSSNRESPSTHSGGDGRGTTPTAILQFRHRMYDDITNDALKRGNSPLAQAVGGGKNPHRSH